MELRRICLGTTSSREDSPVLAFEMRSWFRLPIRWDWALSLIAHKIEIIFCLSLCFLILLSPIRCGGTRIFWIQNEAGFCSPPVSLLSCLLKDWPSIFWSKKHKQTKLCVCISAILPVYQCFYCFMYVAIVGLFRITGWRATTSCVSIVCSRPCSGWMSDQSTPVRTRPAYWSGPPIARGLTLSCISTASMVRTHKHTLIKERICSHLLKLVTAVWEEFELIIP